MKIVVLDGNALNPGDISWDELKTVGDVTIYDRSPADDAIILERVNDAEIILSNKTVVSKTVIQNAPNLKYIGALAAGYNTIDVAAAKEKNIIVTNVPTYGPRAVGQFAIALLLEICNRVGHHDDAVKEGRWSKNLDFCFWDYPLIELENKTIGIIGFGNIGICVGRIAKAMGMNVLANDLHQTEEGKTIATYTDIDTILKTSDVISLHCPLFAETTGLINKNTIAKMKDGVIIINNSRGGLIIEQDLADALNSGKIAAAGLDVVTIEPIKEDNPLLTAKNCIITPHISWAATETRARLLHIAVQNLQAFIKGEPVHVVNK